MTTNRVPLTLFTHVRSITDHASWSDPLNPSDPWNGYPYQWDISVSVQSQTHSDPYTPRPYAYNGLDVTIGDWLVFGEQGLAVEIISISSQDDYSLTMTVEDVALHNILNDPGQSGNGIGTVSAANEFDCLIINLNSEGVPIFASIPDYSVPINLVADITNRFQFRNYIQDFIPATQPGHAFSVGDVIYLDADGTYHSSIASTARSTQSIGTVSSIDQPSVGDFTYRPIGRYVRNLPTLPGLPGDLIYISGTVPGGFTDVPPAPYAIPVYIKIDDNSGILKGGASGTGGSGNIVINGNDITAVNPDGSINLITNGTGIVTIGNVAIAPEYISTVTPGVPLIISANDANVQVVTTLDLAGNRIINVADPQQNQDVATKSYVDAVASGLNAKEAVRAATTETLDATYLPNASYGSLTGNHYERLRVDGYDVNQYDRILIKNQTDEIQNGIYGVIQIGGISQPWILSRTADFNGQPPAGTIKAGDFVFIEYGDTLQGTGWVQTTPNPITVNLSPIHWTQFSSAGVIEAGFGLTKTGTVLDVNVAAIIDTNAGLMAGGGSGGHVLIEIKLDNMAPLEFYNGSLRVKQTIAGTGLSYSLPTGNISINNNQPTITGIGNVTSGTWSAGTIGYQYGGTGLSVLGSPRQVIAVNPAGTALEYVNQSRIFESDIPPTDPSIVDGDRWYNTDTGMMFTRITDTNGEHWIEL